jgi:hypothetical protein
MRSAHNVHRELGLWSNLGGKTACVLAFIVCGSIASLSGLVTQMAGRDANLDARSVIAAVPFNPATLLATIVSTPSPAAIAPDSRQGTASPSDSPQSAPLHALPAAVTGSVRETTTELSHESVTASRSPQSAPTASTRQTTGLPQQPVAASNSPATAPVNAIPTAATASTREETTGLPQWPAAASNDSQKTVRSSNQRNHGRYDAAGWGRYAHERPSSGW